MKSITHKLALLFVTLGFCLIASISAYADNEPIDIAADHMTSTEKSNSVTFTGNVDAKKGEVRIRSDKMVVHYSQNSDTKGSKSAESSSQKVEKIVCTGNVEITKGDWLGTGDQLDYLETKRQAFLTGNARAFKGKNATSGHKIIYYLDENRSEVISGTTTLTEGGKKEGGRVHMTLPQN